jgi:hypothetical protein
MYGSIIQDVHKVNVQLLSLITYTRDKAICEGHGSTVHNIFNGNVVNVFDEAMFHVTG